MKIAVIGSGIIGTLTAYELARRGHDVKVFDREDQPAMKCSHANGGQISVCNAETWNTWSNVYKGLKWMLRDDAPLLIRPSPSIAKLKWLAGFLKHTVNGSHVENTIETIKIGKRSSALYDEIIAREGLQFDQSKCGLLHVYTKEQSLESAWSRRQLFEDNGVEWQYKSPEEVIAIDPAMKTFRNLQGGIMTSTDWTGDAFKFCAALQKICEEKYGVRFYFNSEIERIFHGIGLFYTERTVPQAEAFGRIVICAGHEIATFAKALGDPMNVYPVKGYSITIDNAEGAPLVSLLDDDKKIVCAKLGDRLRVAGTAELDGANDGIRDERIEPLLRWVQENFPAVKVNGYTPWACLRPMNSNMMPIVRRSANYERVFYHGGHGHLGWTLGAGTTETLMDIMNLKSHNT